MSKREIIKRDKLQNQKQQFQKLQNFCLANFTILKQKQNVNFAERVNEFRSAIMNASKSNAKASKQIIYYESTTNVMSCIQYINLVPFEMRNLCGKSEIIV